MKFPPIDSKKSISQNEEDILQFWEKEKVFEKSVVTRNPHYEYVFYDGPPFATGLPHYGHLLASTIKDVVPRYWTMKGYRVERRFGWDCHGLPVENLVEKELGSRSKKDIEERIGIAEFNEACRSKVDMYVSEWKKVVKRLGRWVDFENDYKTMDLDFMESVIWVFAELHKKDLIYEGRRISLYCSRCSTPLSAFEIAMDNSYKIRHDQTATVKFRIKNQESRIKGGENTFFLAWTTTPWTLPSNFGLCVNMELTYVVVKKEYDNYIVAEKLVEKHFGESAEIIEKFSGKELVGKEYEPLFPYFSDKAKEGLFRVVGADFVSDTDGTGIVHLAPFGEDDFTYANENKLPIHDMDAVDDHGVFTEAVTDFMGMSVIHQDTNKQINLFLEEQGKLFQKEQYSHSYPHCYRCETPLIYKPQRAYFIAVHKIKDQMIANNQKINWVPDHLKEGRFGKGIETAPDWNISRNRYWGTPIPIWKCNSCDNERVIGAIEELEKLSGEKVNDLHKHFVDKYTWPCEKCSGYMQRTPEVLDCWVESGSMPYAQGHFPFENKEKFNKSFPGDFIAEYIAQTRGWFYTLHVLSTALMGSNSFKNCICTGTILAEDGTKMSKSKNNYPDPTLIFNKYGADPMRYYLMGSSVMKGENFNFAERGVEEVLKTVILPLQNAYNFFSTYANIDQWQPTKFILARHGEAEHNALCIYSCNTDNEHHLTKKGRQQAKNAAIKLPPFDVLISSPFVRTRETAEIIKKETKFEGEIIIDDLVREVDVGELEKKSLVPRRDRFAAKGAEQVEDILSRCHKFLEQRRKEFTGKTIVVTTHGDIVKACHILEAGAPHIYEEFDIFPKVHTGNSVTVFLFPEPKNDLDKWILSELQTTIKDFQTAFDKYELETALRAVPNFIDNLNNWYLRRSRRRFWEGNPGQFSADKQSAYETLHHVLLVMSKILAPICPFFAEKLFQDLGGRESVHLCMNPYVIEKWVDKKTEEHVAISREIVRLAAMVRARKKIKLRQPLQRLWFALSTGNQKINLPLEVIKEEANVKDIEILHDLEGIAQKIVRVDARQVGKKFGKKVQELIREGKAGNFIELEGGKIEILGDVLEVGEYTFGFLCNEGVEAESTTRSVVLLDTEITEELEIEGYAREIIRTIQEMRKNSGFDVSDRIVVSYSTLSEVLQKAFSVFMKVIAEEVLAEKITSSEVVGDEAQIDRELVKIQLEKVV